MILRALALAAFLMPFAAKAEVEIQEITSPGGITAWLVEEHSIPFVALEIAFDGGTSLEPLDKRGATHLMMALLEEGAGDLDARTFQQERESLAAAFRFDAGADSLRIEAQFLTENRAASVALLRLAINAPRFDADPIERVRGQVLASLQGKLTDPSDIAYDTLFSKAFPGHPYGSTLEGTPESVAALTRQDLLEAHRATLTRDRLRVGVVGDITPEDLGTMLDDLLGDLPATGADAPPHIPYDLAGGVTVKSFDSPQSVVVFSQPGMAFADPDYLTFMVLNHIVGGTGFNARLQSQVREKRGLTYSIGTYIAARELSQQWVGQFASSNAVVGEAIDVIRTIWADMAENGPTDAEVEAAITYLTGSYPLRFDGNARIAGILAGMQLLGLSRDYIPSRNDLVLAITPDDVRRLAKRLMDPEALHFVVVGEPLGISATD